MKKNCQQCNKQFNTYKSRIADGKGKCCSKECDRLTRIGKAAWNKGIVGIYKWNDLQREVITKANRGNKYCLGKTAWNKGKKGIMVAWNKGKKVPQITGENNSNWKGGITPMNNRIRWSLEYKVWQRAVLNRDYYTCQACSENRKTLLTAHHIKNFSKYTELRFSVSNGVTLCRPCHKIFHHFYGKKNNNMYQAIQFINSQIITG